MASDLTDEAKKTVIVEQLRQIGESEYFRGSPRCRQFLEYSVNYVLSGRPLAELKERTVGIEVFRKAGNYDTAQDNTVRVTANEVRKRLAQYYGDGGHKTYPIFQIPIGSYAVSFRWEADEPAATLSDGSASGRSPTPPAPKVGAPIPRAAPRWKLPVLLAATVALLMLAGVFFHQRSADVVRRAWSPFLENAKPVVICVGEPMAYRPASNHDVPEGPADRMVPLPGQFVGTGDAYALADISRYLSYQRMNWTLMARSSTSSETLFNSPVILVGAYSNPWTLTLMAKLRFYFGINNTIYDRSKPGVSWSVPMSSNWGTGHDYAIVARFISPNTGQPVMIVAGIESYGTRVATQFVLDQNLLTDALRGAPKDWDQKNFEFVLSTKIIGKTPDRPKVVAAHFW